jgi:hypothetical protein
MFFQGKSRVHIYFHMKWTFSQTHLATLALVVSAPLASESREIESLQAKYVKIITLDSCIIIYVPLLKPRGQFFKTSVGANSRVGASKAKSNTGVGTNFSRRHENQFKKLPSDPGMRVPAGSFL